MVWIFYLEKQRRKQDYRRTLYGIMIRKKILLPFVERTPSGFRIFKDSDLEWLAVISCLKSTGMSIKDIKKFINWCMEGDSTLEKRLNMFKKQKERVQDQMKELQGFMDEIDYKIWYYRELLFLPERSNS